MHRETWAAYAYNPLPEQQYTRGTCEGLRHRGQGRPAPAHYLELIYEQDQETLTVRQAWRTCDACHAEVEMHRARLEGRGAPGRPPSRGEPYAAGPRHSAPDHRRDRLLRGGPRYIASAATGPPTRPDAGSIAQTRNGRPSSRHGGLNESRMPRGRV